MTNDLTNIRLLYANRIFSNLIPAYVIERLFWEERGMTIQMVVYTEILFAVAVVLFEVPAGVLADKWGRKPMLVLAALLGCCEFLILVYATEFWHFALVAFLTAVARSASSGTENALLYDSLGRAGMTSSFEKSLGRLNAVDLSSVMLAALCGSLLADRFGYELNYWISFVSMLVSLCVTMMLVEPAPLSGEKTERPLPLHTYVTHSLRLYKSRPSLLLVVLSGMVTGAAVNFIDEFWQLYLDRLGIPVISFGLFSAALFLLRMPGNLLAYKLKNRFSYRKILSGVTAALAVGFFALAFLQNIGGLAALFAICLFSGVIDPLAAGYLHHRAETSVRATMDSFRSLGENAVIVLTGLGFGYFAAKWDVFGGYGFIGIICSAFLVYFMFASKGRTDLDS